MSVTGSLFRVASLWIWKVSLTFLMMHLEIKKSLVLMQIAMVVIGTSKHKGICNIYKDEKLDNLL